MDPPAPFFSLSLAGGGPGWGSRSRRREERERALRRPAAGAGAPPPAGLFWGAMTAIPFPDAIMRDVESVAARLA